MRQQRLIFGCCAIASILLTAARINAEHPIFSYDLEVLPELSTLTVTGGFAGVHHVYQLDGQLGLTVDEHPHPPDTANAQFDLVKITLHGDGFFNGNSLNDHLRMIDWVGLRVDEDTISFTGQDGQGAPITASADVGPSLVRLRGENMPGCCDFFSHSFDIVALNRHTPHGRSHADFDEDGDVDGDDWLDALVNFGDYGSVTHKAGDADTDGDVDHLDLMIWKATAGRGVAATSATTAAAAPEPASFMLAILSIVLLIGRRPRRQVV